MNYLKIALFALMVSCAHRARPAPDPDPVGMEAAKARTVKLSVACEGKGWATGSGVLLSADVVLTAHHVIRCEGDALIVVTHQGAVVIAMELDSLIEADLSLLALTEALPFTGITFGGIPAVGEVVCAYPARKVREPVCGKVRNYSQAAKNDIGMFLPVQPGDSGSGLYDSAGNLVGVIISRIAKDPPTGEILGFATALYGRLEVTTGG